MILKKNTGLLHNMIIAIRGLFYSEFHLFLLYPFYTSLFLAIYFYISTNKIFSYVCFLTAIFQYIMSIYYDERYRKIKNKNYLLANCLDSLPSLFLILDKDWKVVFANDIFQAFSIGKVLASFEDVLECFNENTELCQILKDGRDKLEIDNHFCKNILIDEEKSWRIYMGILKKSNKNFYVCYISDIQEGTSSRENKLQQIVNELPEGICIYNQANNTIEYINNTLTSVLKNNNITAENILEDLKNFADKKSFVTSYKNDKDKVLLKFEKIKESDITVYKVLINENIMKSMSIYDDNNMIGVLLIDQDLNIIESNNKFNNLINSYFVKRTTFLQYIDASHHNLVKQYFKNKLSKEVAPISVTLGSGSPILLHGENLSNVGWILFIQDNSVQKELETKLFHTQRLGLLGQGQIISSICHDVNNILTAINGFFDIFTPSNSGDQSPEAKIIDTNTYAKSHIIYNLHRLEKLVQYIGAWSKESVEGQETDVNETISNCLNSMGRLLGEKISINVIKSEKGINAYIPCIHLEQILLNLTINARDAMKDGGVITITTNLIDSSTLCNIVKQEVAANSFYLELCVSDTGEGISEQNKKKIFDSFFTTKQEGTGLGLSIIQSLIQKYQGFIQLNSQLNVGTTFKVYLPAIQKEEEEDELTEPNKTRIAGEKKIINVILVEDDVSIRSLLQQGLRKRPYLNVTAFKSIKESLEYITTCQNVGLQIHLVISDIMITDGNGLQLVEKIAELKTNTKYILISGYDKQFLETLPNYSVLNTHSQDIVFLQKPFYINEVLVLIDSFYDKF